jgi:hypothetical protein
MAKITEHIKIHDKFQFEMKFDYALSKHRKNTDYKVDTYFFLPNSLGINRESYPGELFYRDIQTYIRFLTPPVTLEELVKQTRYIRRIKESLAASEMEQESHVSRTEQSIHHIKMLCNVFRSTAKAYILDMDTLSKEISREKYAQQYIQYSRELLQQYRDLAVLLETNPGPSDSLERTYSYGDEYLSLLFEKFAFLLLERVKETNPILFKDLKPEFLNAISREIDYRHRNRFHPEEENTTNYQERIYRNGELKRYFESNLFIDTRVKPEGRLVLQIVYGLAAGLAMVFATVVAFLAQRTYGSFTTPLFFALVLSYIFKDRIKELSRTWIYSRWAKKAFDHKTSFFLGKNHLGYSKEHFAFRSRTQIDPLILKMRNRRMTTLDDILEQERVFLYRKTIRIYSRNIREEFRDHSPAGVTDITRFNVSKIIRKMDDPKKTLFVLKTNSYTRVNGRKVYHLNLVTRYTSSTDVIYKRSRIIFNRNGIKSIQEIDPE